MLLNVCRATHPICIVNPGARFRRVLRHRDGALLILRTANANPGNLEKGPTGDLCVNGTRTDEVRPAKTFVNESPMPEAAEIVRDPGLFFYRASAKV